MDSKFISKLKYTFVIPYQQRGYRWTPDNVRILLNDFKDFIDSNTECKFYCLQPIAVVPDGNKYIVIDGQQRLTTLYLLRKYLQPDDKLYEFEYERDNEKERENFISQISDCKTIDDSKIDFYYISQAYITIKKWFHEDDAEEKERCQLKETLDNKQESINEVKKAFIDLLNTVSENEKHIKILWYIVEKEKEHEAFRNINSGKIQLSNSDLIKALLLNETNGIENHQQIAAQFELMERQFAEDRFWYMLQQKEVEFEKGQTRIDLLFNMVAKIKDDDYQIDSRKAFFKFSNYSTDELKKMWEQVREIYQRLRDLYDDPYTFHYVGFLTYCDMKLTKILEGFENVSKSQYVSILKNKIKDKMPNKSLEDYTYEDPKKELRRLFVLHNIETILSRYKEQKENHSLRFAYENLPFELLYNHSWNIEHIASHTDNTLKSEQDRKDWINSVSSDFSDIFKDKKLCELKAEAEKDLEKDESFNNLYKEIIKNVNDNPIKSEEDKNKIGNLVLLDEHTNKSFHNSLFPRKRRIVVMASGLKNQKDIEKNVKSVFVPICTQQVYTKSYNKQSNVKLNCWGQGDYNAYFADIQEKLNFYLKN